MPRIVFPDFSNHSSTRSDGKYVPYLAMDVVCLRHDARESLYAKPGDYWVARADNRRILGSLEHPKDLMGKPTSSSWWAWPVVEAFRGFHFDDNAIWDTVPGDLYRSPRGGFTGMGGFPTRDQSAESLLQYLYEEQAPALGFGHHYRVRCAERLHEPVVTRRKMSAGPFPTERVRNEWGYDDHVVPTDAAPLRLDILQKVN